jgi:hypothetical protein
MMPGYGKALAWVASGVGLTLGSLLIAPQGGHGYVFWGAMLYGVIALYQAWRAAREVAEIQRLTGTSRERAAAMRATMIDAQRDARLIHDTPGVDDYESWQARQQSKPIKCEQCSGPGPVTVVGEPGAWKELCHACIDEHQPKEKSDA